MAARVLAAGHGRPTPSPNDTAVCGVNVSRQAYDGFALEHRACIPYFDLDRVARASDAFRPGGSSVTVRIVQLEIFPEVRHVEAVDPRVAIGPDTRVAALYRVRYGGAPQVHQVYHDRHGWYCAEHGPACSAVIDAVDVASPR